MISLYAHQKHGVDLARAFPRFLFNYEMGTGKTITMLSVCNERPMKTLVVCPKAIIDAAWLSDGAHYPGIDMAVARGTRKADRVNVLRCDHDIVVINYEMLRFHEQDVMGAGFRRLILDESSKIKNWKAKTTRIVLNLSRKMAEVYLLSGTPAPNGEHEYWAQLRCVYPEATDPSSFRWCSQWFYPQKKTFGGKSVVTGWTLKDHVEFEYYLSQRCHVLRKADCLDLPEKVDIYRTFDLADTERQTYDEILEDLQSSAAGHVIDATIQGRLMRLRQIVNGWAMIDGHRPVQVGDSKLSVMSDVHEEIGSRPAVVWAEFTHDIDALCGLMDCPAIDGRTTDKQRLAILDAWHAGKTTRLVCHPAAVGHGITLVEASHMVFFSLSFSFEQYAQARDRIHRIGQKDHCTYIHLIGRDTVDEHLLAVVQRKKTRHEALTELMAEPVGA